MKLRLIAMTSLCVLPILPLDAQVVVGDRPSVSLSTFEGAPVTLAELEGSVVLFDFWATWCAPCRQSFPFYTELRAEFAARGFEVVAASVDTDAEALADFLASDEAPPFRIVWDRDHTVVGAFEPEAMPTSYLIDRSGTVRYVHHGFGVEDREVIRAQLVGLLDEPAVSSALASPAAEPPSP